VDPEDDRAAAHDHVRAHALAEVEAGERRRCVADRADRDDTPGLRIGQVVRNVVDAEPAGDVDRAALDDDGAVVAEAERIAARRADVEGAARNAQQAARAWPPRARRPDSAATRRTH